MVAEQLDTTVERARAPLLLTGYVLSWAGAIALLVILLFNGQLRDVEQEFQLAAGAMQRDLELRLYGNEALIESLAQFVRMDATEPRLVAYVEALTARFPTVYQLAVQRRWRQETSAADTPVSTAILASAGYEQSGNLFGEHGDAARESLRRGVDRALLLGRPAVAGPFSLATGEPAYALIHPVYTRDDPAYGEHVVAMIVRGNDLLDKPEMSRTTVVLRPLVSSDGFTPHAGATDESTRWAAKLFPLVRHRAYIGGPNQRFELIITRQLGWELLDPFVIAAGIAISIASLLLLLGYARARIRREDDDRALAQRLYFLANYDSLTGLPNRNLFRDRLQRALSRARRHQAAVAVLFLDLDGFKAVNDNAGHDAGDRLLVEVARRLRGCVRDQDTVARMSGDEFVVILEDIETRCDAERVVSEIQVCLEEPVDIDGRRFAVTASVGVALYPEDGQGETSLLRTADRNMYSQKHREWRLSI